jgi:hypothetical protein
MAKRIFYSFHFIPDNWRVSQIRNIGAIEGNRPATDNEWHTITQGGDAAIKRWIAEQMHGKSCTVVLIGAQTAGRKWINHEISQTWSDRKGIVGIYIHKLKDRLGQDCTKGSNPFDHVKLADRGQSLSSIVKAYDPPGFTSTEAYDSIRNNIASWIDEAIAIRAKY